MASAAAADDAPAAVWADVLAATERAARLGAVYSIDTGTELVADARTGTQASARRCAQLPRRRVASAR
jgi:hypothetical protein